VLEHRRPGDPSVRVKADHDLDRAAVAGGRKAPDGGTNAHATADGREELDPGNVGDRHRLLGGAVVKGGDHLGHRCDLPLPSLLVEDRLGLSVGKPEGSRGDQRDHGEHHKHIEER
jgi:hypothetical protein